LKDGSPVCIQTDFKDLKLYRRGKVRDIYEAGDKLLLIASDRISAFDVVLPTPIPMKGAVLTQLSIFWFGMIGNIVGNHLVSAEVGEFPDEFQPYEETLRLRSMLVKRAQIFPVECVARGYLVGSGWKEYRETGAVCGITLPAGLRECDRLPAPIFTPATKADEGHDMNIPFHEMEKIVGPEYASKLRDLTFQIYRRAADFAIEKGIIIADTKFEFGLYDGEILVCDEVLTPDSSRLWLQDDYEPGRAQVSFDKQYVRDYLEEIQFDKQPPGPELPVAVVEGTTGKYLEAYRLLTGTDLLTGA